MGGGYRTITSKHLNGFGALEGCSPAGPEWADGYGCTKHIRRFNVWGHWDVGTLKISGPGYDVGANWGAPVHGMNAGHMLYEPMHRGYGAPVVLGEQYTLTGQMHDEMILDFSDNVLASYFGHSESVHVQVGSNACHLHASDDKRFVSPLGLPSNLLLLPTHSPTPPTPLAPGCYYKQALASSKCPGPFLDWERDVWGVANANSGASQEDCMARKAGHDEHCEVSTEWRFVASAPTAAPFTPPPTPTPTRSPTPPPTPSPTRLPTPPTPLSPGCYYKQTLASSKCPGSGPFLDWVRDVWGEANANSGASQEDC